MVGIYDWLIVILLVLVSEIPMLFFIQIHFLMSPREFEFPPAHRLQYHIPYLALLNQKLEGPSHAIKNTHENHINN
jgi:hypothetical protein